MKLAVFVCGFIFLWLLIINPERLPYSQNSPLLSIQKPVDKLVRAESDLGEALRQLHDSTTAAALHGDATFKSLSDREMAAARLLKDSSAIAGAYWNLGLYYLKKEVLDSSFVYYKAAHSYYQTSNRYFAAKMLYNLAYISSRVYNYTESEILIFEAIEIFRDYDKPRQLFNCYNLLAVLSRNLKEYDEAIAYYETARTYLSQINSDLLLTADNLNNTANVYQELKDYDYAGKLYREALAIPHLEHLDKALFARLTDNYSRNRLFLNDTINLESSFLQALRLREEMKFKAGIVRSHLSLALFYLHRQDTLAARHHAQTALDIGEDHLLLRDALQALLFLADITPEASQAYLSKYIQLNNQVQENERQVRNKFARIVFETDRFKAENQALKREKYWIITGAMAVLLILSMGVFISIQRSRNETLRIQAIAQQAKEEILELTIKEQSSREAGKLQERNRIAADLHDKVLSELFGLRLNLSVLSPIGTAMEEEFDMYLRRLQHLEGRIRTISHQLYENEFATTEEFEIKLQELLEGWAMSGAINVHSTIRSEALELLTPVERSHLFPVLEEGFKNIYEHSQASDLWFTIYCKDAELLVCLRDNGIGFEHPLSPSEVGIGLKTMESRLHKIGASLSLKSILGKGTTLKISISKNS